MKTNNGKNARQYPIKVRVLSDVWDVLRAATPTHLHLRNRLVTAFVVTLIVDLIGSVAIYFAESSLPSTQIHNFGDALYWTSAQMTTLSSKLPNPVTGVGEIITLVLDLYAITVVSSLAGMFSAFFHRRSHERDPQHGNTAT